MADDEIQYFATPAGLQAWFAANHETAAQLLLGYHKVGSGIPSVTWPQSVDEALCVGWIDGVRKSIDKERYFIRFTPRKAKSYWSKVNLNRFAELQERGRVLPAGLAAYDARAGEVKAAYSFEQDEEPAFTPEEQARFETNQPAWAWFSKRPVSYRRPATWWVISAKHETTRERRLAQLIECSAAETTIPLLTRPQGRK